MATTVILGAGVIGVSTAYYLSEHQPGSTIHLVEPSPELFASASGYAGGFMAKDWFSPASAELGALSFEEHRKLADKDGGAGKWGYAPSTSISLTASKNKKRVDAWCRDGASRAEAANGEPFPGVPPSWLRRVEGDAVEVTSEEGTTAQVDPLHLCQHLLRKCLDARVRLHHPARAILVQTDVRDELASVRIADTRSGAEIDVPCARVVVAAGAWSPQAFAELFPAASLGLPITTIAGHSLLARSPRWTRNKQLQEGCHALFLSSAPGYSPEIFSRADGNIYVTGLNSAAEPLPPLPTDARGGIRKSDIVLLRATAREVFGAHEDGDDGRADDRIEVLREGLCFRPVTARGTPILGRIPDHCLGPAVKTRPGAEGGVFLASGHGPWGISQSLGTGKVMAEMMQGRPLSADVSRLGLEGVL
ncbi:hypothetical protein DL764_008726 [Monosporascus ibericus]|uniref:FAD dependent oxidoreductase domain-containing protein n=1 Tax=Monosporascus ibericus TaxID=155417 RepID=A0A4V1X965_9PEZI|nr:hypothetical protein DL764_008726 [Monosporascus ibericus]